MAAPRKLGLNNTGQGETHLLVKDSGFDNDIGDPVGIYAQCEVNIVPCNSESNLLTSVGGGTTVLQVSVALLIDMSRNTNRRATICNTSREVADVSGLVTTR